MTHVIGFIRRRPWASFAVLAIPLLVLVVALSRPSRAANASLTATVTRGTLHPRITTSGILRPVQSITYRSPLGGRETEITFLVTEGTRVAEGDLLVRLDTTDLQADFERTRQERRQAEVDLQVADIDRQQAKAAVESLTNGEGTLGVDEATTRVQLAQKKVDRLKEESEGLEPLVKRGFLTQEEYRRTADALEQAQEEVVLAKRRADVLLGVTRPQERQRAELQRAQKEAQYENVRARVQEVEARLQRLAAQIDGCSLYAKRPGLVVYDEYLSASQRRKIRLGDRVTGTQGLVTIPDVDRMVVETSLAEGDVHRVHPGQTAVVALEAFPGVSLTGKVATIGALASASTDRPFDQKRFDVTIALDPTATDVRPEMTARADIVLNDRPSALLVPVNAIFDRPDGLVAHVVRAFGVETRAIEIGESDGERVEVTRGLREGDRVTLADASSAGAAAPSSASKLSGTVKPLAKPQGDDR
jgi:HlyD family secretion protein